MKAVCKSCNGRQGKRITGVPRNKPSWQVCPDCNGRGWTKESVVSTTVLKAWAREIVTHGVIVVDPAEFYAKIAQWGDEG